MAVATAAHVNLGCLLGSLILIGVMFDPEPARGRERGEDDDALRVEVEVAGRTHYVGQGIELGIGVVGGKRRPEIDAPVIDGADVWLIGTALRPLSVGGIGSSLSGSNVFVTRYRVVPRRPGTLEVPSIRARLRGEEGRTRPVRLEVKPVPPDGRTSAFLGGVGSFTLGAEASPRTVRVNQEMEYRITVRGPASWGMTGRPELDRFDRVSVGLRVKPGITEAIHEPASRTFVYRLRPTRAGEAHLPPVAISAFDPSSQRYVTRLTPAVPIRVVAVAEFDPALIPDLRPSVDAETRRAAAVRWTVGVGAALVLLVSGLAIGRIRRRGRLMGLTRARRFAAHVARELAESRRGVVAAGAADQHGSRRDEATGSEAAERVAAALVRYLELGIDRPPGALTPEEAGDGVARITGSSDLAEQAARLAARCDALLFRDGAGARTVDEGFAEDARMLFGRLAES